MISSETDVDVIVTMPSVMGKLGPLGRVLGPRGLMPNPKTGTVTMDVAKAVSDVKAGKIDFKVDLAGVNIMEFCKQFNGRTQDKKGKVLPVAITVYKDKSFEFVIKTPPAAGQIPR